jgi:hypothetical protein
MNIIKLKIPSYNKKDLKECKRISTKILEILDKEDLRIVLMALSDVLKLVYEEYEENLRDKI